MSLGTIDKFKEGSEARKFAEGVLFLFLFFDKFLYVEEDHGVI